MQTPTRPLQRPHLGPGASLSLQPMDRAIRSHVLLFKLRAASFVVVGLLAAPQTRR